MDSGLGEWDSESSRKTSFSSQGRLSPDFTMEKTKVKIVMSMSPLILMIAQEVSESAGRGDGGKLNSTAKSGAKRRRSGLEMVGAPGGKVMIPARLPRIAKSSRATGVWSRKISPAGISYLKMDDEVRTEGTWIQSFVLSIKFSAIS